ncbi:hypothetical protein TR631_12335 [Streptomyces rochei]|uniref:hypothetical protein n=1 Tax=Streptomyces rochei TaxID=1928 RepID=UPI002ACDC1D6|nr:hypothetical protein [Streptomyces rochei]WQC12555.1 hypothetical protein TR631_12335 [Streptomyces rochei]
MSGGLQAVAMPDAEQVTVRLLKPALPTGTIVGTEWPADWDAKLAAGIVSVTLGGGGSRQKPVTADRTLDIDILGATKKQAFNLATTVSSLLIAAQGTSQPGARIYGVEETSLVWLPYQPSAETDAIPRYVLVMSMVVRPA